MRFVKIIISTVIILLGIVFIIENLEVLKQPVSLMLNLYVVSFQSPDVYLWVLVLFAFFLGVFTTSFTASTSTIFSARPSASSGTIWRFWPRN